MTLSLHSLYSIFFFFFFSFSLCLLPFHFNMVAVVPTLCVPARANGLAACVKQRIQKHHLILSASHQVQHTLLLSSSFALLYFLENKENASASMCIMKIFADLSLGNKQSTHIHLPSIKCKLIEESIHLKCRESD